MEVVASLSQGRTAAAQCSLFTFKSVPVIFEPPCSLKRRYAGALHQFTTGQISCSCLCIFISPLMEGAQVFICISTGRLSVLRSCFVSLYF